MPRGVYLHKGVKGRHWKIKDTSNMHHTAWNKGKSNCFIFTEEWRRKISENRKGITLKENHYRWIRDRSLINKKERNNPEYKQWRLEVYKKDNYKCKMENCDCKGKIIAHHILPWHNFPELRYNINNGITLCQFHHPRKRSEEQILIPFFQSMVEVI
jgi:hypothetical protein